MVQVTRHLKGNDGNEPLFFTFPEGGKMKVVHTASNGVGFLYSNDNVNWYPYQESDQGYPIIDVPSGGVIFFKSDSTSLSDEQNQYSFYFSADVYASGDVTSLIKYKKDIPAYCFAFLFSGCPLLSAPKLSAKSIGSYGCQAMFLNCKKLVEPCELPATRIERYAYDWMFGGCTALRRTPDLRALSIAPYCYARMFDGCSALTSCSSLPALSVPEGAYQEMFSGCSSLRTVPKLPATTVEDYAYRKMFFNCTNLGGESFSVGLPAPGPGKNAYENMFSGCLNLNAVYTEMIQFKDNATLYWLNNVSAVGEFYCQPSLGTEDTIERGISRCPEGWSVIDIDTGVRFQKYNSELTGSVKLCTNDPIPACQFVISYNKVDWVDYPIGAEIVLDKNTSYVVFKAKTKNKTLGNKDIEYRFYEQVEDGNRWLLVGNIMSLLDRTGKGDAIPEYAFQHLFRDCKGIYRADYLKFPAPTIGERGYYGMFQECSSLLAIPYEWGAAFLEKDAFALTFAHCASLKHIMKTLVLTAADELSCESMFENCVSLTRTPILVIQNTKNCFRYMFYGCSSLRYLFLDLEWNGLNITDNFKRWLHNVRDSGKAVYCVSNLDYGENANVAEVIRGPDAIPENWEIELRGVKDIDWSVYNDVLNDKMGEAYIP